MGQACVSADANIQLSIADVHEGKTILLRKPARPDVLTDRKASDQSTRFAAPMSDANEA
jgi:hypothetical protein